MAVNSALVRSGPMRHPLALYRRSESGGHAAIAEDLVVTLWGSLIGLAGGSQGIVSDSDFRFETRYVDGLDPSLVASLTTIANGVTVTRRFHLRSVQDPDGRRRRLVIFLRELVPGPAKVA